MWYLPIWQICDNVTDKLCASIFIVTAAEPQISQIFVLQPQFSSRCNIQIGGITAVNFCHANFYKRISKPKGNNPNRAVKNGRNYSVRVLPILGTEPSALLSKNGSLSFTVSKFFI